MKQYVVTERAGAWVAGRRVSQGDVLALSDRAAEHELRVGTIKPAGASQSKPINLPKRRRRK